MLKQWEFFFHNIKRLLIKIKHLRYPKYYKDNECYVYDDIENDNGTIESK